MICTGKLTELDSVTEDTLHTHRLYISHDTHNHRYPPTHPHPHTHTHTHTLTHTLSHSHTQHTVYLSGLSSGLKAEETMQAETAGTQEILHCTETTQLHHRGRKVAYNEREHNLQKTKPFRDEIHYQLHYTKYK